MTTGTFGTLMVDDQNHHVRIIGAGHHFQSWRNSSNSAEYYTRASAFSNHETLVSFVDGNVGVGTTTPEARLHVRFDSTIHGDHVIRVEDNAPRFVITKSGNVGVGTSNPRARLHVQGGIRLEGETGMGVDEYVYNPFFLTDTFITFGKAGSSNHWAYLRRVNNGGDDYTMALDLHATSTEGFQIRTLTTANDPTVVAVPFTIKNGRCGIGGPTHETYTLQVQGDVSIMFGWVRTYGPTGWFSETYGGGWFMQDFTWLRAYSDKSIFTGGDIQANGTITGGTFVGNGYSLSNLHASNISTGNLHRERLPAAFQVNTDTPSVYVSSAGNVGIGTTATTARLHVDGNIYSTGDITGLSDARVKTDMERIASPLEKIAALRGYTYRRIDQQNNPSQRFLGLIAQEVKAVLPEAVHDAPNGTLAIAYGNLAALFVESINELHAKLQTLTNV